MIRIVLIRWLLSYFFPCATWILRGCLYLWWPSFYVDINKNTSHFFTRYFGSRCDAAMKNKVTSETTTDGRQFQGLSRLLLPVIHLPNEPQIRLNVSTSCAVRFSLWRGVWLASSCKSSRPPFSMACSSKRAATLAHTTRWQMRWPSQLGWLGSPLFLSWVPPWTNLPAAGPSFSPNEGAGKSSSRLVPRFARKTTNSPSSSRNVPHTSRPSRIVYPQHWFSIFTFFRLLLQWPLTSSLTRFRQAVHY